MSAFSTSEILHNVVQHAAAGKSYRTLCQLCIEAELNIPDDIRFSEEIAQFYNIFMVSLLVTSQLNEAKYLWKRIPSHFKPTEPSNASQLYLRILWDIGVGLWESDLAKAYNLLLTTSWPEILERHVRNLRLSILRDTIRRLSTVHNKVSLAMLETAIGHSQQVIATEIGSFSWQIDSDSIVALPVNDGSQAKGDVAQLQQLLDNVDKLSDFVSYMGCKPMKVELSNKGKSSR
eukprot:gene7961-5727_t